MCGDMVGWGKDILGGARRPCGIGPKRPTPTLAITMSSADIRHIKVNYMADIIFTVMCMYK